MAKTNNLHDFLVDLANAIRTKKKYPDSQKINPQNFSEEIDGISGENKLTQLLNKTITEVTEEDFGEATKVDNTIFKDCVLLEEVTFPNSVTSIGNDSFRNCTSLTNIMLPDSVTSIGSSPFAGCSAITEVTIPFTGASRTSKYPLGYLFGTMSYAGSVPIIQYYEGGNTTYYFPSSLKKVIVENADSLPVGAFNSCSNITEIILNADITALKNSTFSYCSGLTSIAIPNSVTSIGDSVFSNCSNLTSITIPDGVTSIGETAFYYCTKLKSITIPDGVEKLLFQVFANCTSLTSVTLGNGLASIGWNAFYGCKGLTSVTIPASVTGISTTAFCNCSKLSSATFEGTPSSIATDAFKNDTALLDIYVPWAQGAVSGAPWGATNATIHYNWTPPVPGSDYTGTYTGDGSYSMRYFKIYDANDSLISSGDVEWEGTVTVPQGGHIVVSANETYGGISIKVNNLVNCTASAVDSWTETVTITPTADNFSFNCVDDFD